MCTRASLKIRVPRQSGAVHGGEDVTDANLGRLLNGHVITESPAKTILVNGDVSWAAR